jgi:16S rRNA G1207 methylase RsmC
MQLVEAGEIPTAIATVAAASTAAAAASDDGGAAAATATPAGVLAALVAALDKAVVSKVPAFDSRGIATVLYGYAALGVRPGCSHVLLPRANEIAVRMNPQDVANALWAVGKLHITHETTGLAGLHAQATKLAKQFSPQELAMVMWSLATVGGDRSAESNPLLPLLSVVGGVLDGKTSTAQGVVNISWAAAKLLASDKLGNPIPRRELGVGPASKFGWLPAVERELERVKHSLTVQGLATAAWSMARLGCTADVVSGMVHGRTKLVKGMGGSDLSDVCSALAHCGTGGKSAELMHTVTTRAKQLGTAAPWQMYGHLLHLHHGGGVAEDLEIPAAAAAACSRATDASLVHRVSISEAVQAEIKPLLPATAQNTADRRLLIVNRFENQSAVDAVVKGRQWKVSRWSRNACEDTPGRAFPKTAKTFAACISRMPPTRAAAEMMLDMVVAVVEAGKEPCEVWVVGTATEGIRSLHAYAMALPGLNDIVLVRSTTYRAVYYLQVKLPAMYSRGEDASTGITSITKKAKALEGKELKAAKAAETRVQLERWKLNGKIELEGHPESTWQSYPGLFSGGGLDVMTIELLRALPAPPKHARVLDYGAGSGVIGAALRLRESTCDVHMLDSDVLALEAAAMNVPHSSRYCGDSLAVVPGQFDWIVSNPPVHVELMTDFGALKDLLATAPARLVPGGKLYLVAQQYVPVPHVSDAATKLGLSIKAATGRFTVWEWTAPSTNKADKPPPVVFEDEPASSKREKKSKKLTNEKKKENKSAPTRSLDPAAAAVVPAPTPAAPTPTPTAPRATTVVAEDLSHLTKRQQKDRMHKLLKAQKEGGQLVPTSSSTAAAAVASTISTNVAAPTPPTPTLTAAVARPDKPKKQFVSSAGHGYNRVGEQSMHYDEARIGAMLTDRLKAKLERDFGAADQIRDDLTGMGIEVCDKSKTWKLTEKKRGTADDDDDDAGHSAKKVALPKGSLGLDGRTRDQRKKERSKERKERAVQTQFYGWRDGAAVSVEEKIEKEKEYKRSAEDEEDKTENAETAADGGGEEAKPKKKRQKTEKNEEGKAPPTSTGPKPKRDKTKFTSKGLPVKIKARDTVGKIGFD